MRIRALVTMVSVLAGLGLILGCNAMMETKVGFAGPLTGPQGGLGQELLNGATLAAEKWNGAGGLKGKKVELISMDDEDQPDKAREVARALCRKNPLFVVGHVDSGCSLEAAKVYHDHRVLMITPLSTNPKLTEGDFNNVFRLCGRDDRQGRAAAVWLIKRYPGKTVGVVHDGTEYGRGLAEEFISNYQFLSGVNVLFKEQVTRGDIKMEPIMMKCAAAKPDILYFGGISHQGAALLKNLRESGLTTQFMSGDGCFQKEFIEGAGALAEGTLLTFYPDLASLPGTGGPEFAKQYEKRFGSSPGPYAAFGYEAVSIGLTGVSSAASPLSDRTIGEALKRQSFKTIFGILQFDGKGDLRESPFVMYTVENGQFKELGI
jgi:branched-chain amino acid transport system substrate-binding protein